MSIRIYPVQKVETPRVGYKVKVNGKEVLTDSARVSAVPYNRRWPGHQRPLDQTEAAEFLSMASDEPLSFSITLPRPSDKVKIRPKSLGVKVRKLSPTEIAFELPCDAYFTVEPYGRHEALHIFVDPIEEDRPDTESESRIYYGPGLHDVGQITLTDGQTLYLDEGAVVYACVKAVDASHIAIRGRGILDNSHNLEKYLFDCRADNNTVAVKNVKRQHTIQLEYCTDVTIDGITIRDSLVYNIRPIACRGLKIRNVKIIGCWRYNSDGIDMHNCEDVEISHCFLRTFDDSICVKGFDCYYAENVEEAVRNAMYRNGQAYDRFRNVHVSDCVIWNDWGKCLEIGAETRAEEICGILFEDCDIIHVTSDVLDCMNVDYADAHDITYRNIRVEMDETIPPMRYQFHDDVPYGKENPCAYPPLINFEVVFHEEYSAGGTRRGRNRNLIFEDIQVTGCEKPLIRGRGYSEEASCDGILIRNITVDGKRLGREDLSLGIEGFVYNLRIE